MLSKSSLVSYALLISFSLTACDKHSHTSESENHANMNHSTDKHKTDNHKVKQHSKKTHATQSTVIKTAADAITIMHPQIRALPPGQTNTAMYMHLKNDSASDHELVKVEGDLAKKIELHTHNNDNGVMRMHQVPSIPIAANTTAQAKPGSYHVMIMGLHNDLTKGDKHNFTLIFKDGTRKAVTAEVKEITTTKHSH